jgi:hypothetical protein
MQTVASVDAAGLAARSSGVPFAAGGDAAGSNCRKFYDRHDMVPALRVL